MIALNEEDELVGVLGSDRVDPKTLVGDGQGQPVKGDAIGILYGLADVGVLAVVVAGPPYNPATDDDDEDVGVVENKLQ